MLLKNVFSSEFVASVRIISLSQHNFLNKYNFYYLVIISIY